MTGMVRHRKQRGCEDILAPNPAGYRLTLSNPLKSATDVVKLELLIEG